MCHLGVFFGLGIDARDFKIQYNKLIKKYKEQKVLTSCHSCL